MCNIRKFDLYPNKLYVNLPALVKIDVPKQKPNFLICCLKGLNNIQINKLYAKCVNTLNFVDKAEEGKTFSLLVYLK